MKKTKLNAHKKFLVVIPARGGSKGIPRKNLRILGRKPLIQYSIDLANLFKTNNTDVCVSSDDSEIMQIGAINNTIIHERSLDLSDDHATLDSVVIAATNYCESINNTIYDNIITIQPTSPFLSLNTIHNCLKKLNTLNVDTVLTVQKVNHLSWSFSDGIFKPAYKERLNRQWLPSKYVETGGCVVCKRDILFQGTRFGNSVQVVNVSHPECIDIDTNSDWALAEHVITRRKVAIWTIGSKELGLGHVANMLIVASELTTHDIQFFCKPSELLAIEKIQANNYSITVDDDPFSKIKKWSPDIIINDRLDTTMTEIRRQKDIGATVINFEDLGSGALAADYVINAIYEMKGINSNSNILFGVDYYLLRDEFMSVNKPKKIKQNITDIILTFGGTDPNDLTQKVLNAISNFCESMGIKITVILGLGAKNLNNKFLSKNIKVIRDTKKMSHFIGKADVAFSSAGRTIYELASLEVPSIILCQNERELKHGFADEDFGFRNLGLGVEVSSKEILSELKKLIIDSELRQTMKNKMKSQNIPNGRHKVSAILRNICTQSSNKDII